MHFFQIHTFYKNMEAEMAYHEWQSMQEPF